MNNKAKEWLERGAELLKPLFLRYGFAYRTLNDGDSSGGQFAYGEFRKGARRMEFHFRYSLGLVTYKLNSHSMSHQEYMRSMLGKPNASQYPGFSTDPMDAFRHLRFDLEEHCADFFEGTDECLLRRIEDALAEPIQKSGLPD
jgi:hypothetical protein